MNDTAPPPAAQWYDGIDVAAAGFANTGEFKGYLENRGWDKDSKAAIVGAIKAHREAEKHIGIPVNQIIRLPKDASDQAGWNDLRAKLGVPADEKGYDFAGVKFKDGTDIDEGFRTELGKALLEANVSKDRAGNVASRLVKFMEAQDAAVEAQTTAALAQEKQTLQANWGNHYQANMLLAQRAFEGLGGKDKAGEVIAALEKTVGYAKVMDFMRNIGSQMKEDPFVSTIMRQNGGGPMSADQARATLNDRMRDAAWCKKLDDGDLATRTEFDNLTRMMQPAR